MALVNWDDNYKTMYGTPNQLQGFGMGTNTGSKNYQDQLTHLDFGGEAVLNALKGSGGGFANKLDSSVLNPKGTPTWQSKYLNKDFLGGMGSAMEGLGSLAQGWAALKNLKLSRQAMENQQNQWSTNYEAQRLATNNAIANQNAWKQAQGRTDFGAYVGGKPPGTNYVG